MRYTSIAVFLEMVCYRRAFLNTAHHSLQWTAEGSVLAQSVLCFFFVYEISLELLNGFAPNSHTRRVWSLTRVSLKVEGQGHQG